MNEILRLGPSLLMIATALGVKPTDIKQMIASTPALKQAYKQAIAKVAFLIRTTNGNRTMIAESLSVPRHYVEQWIRENQTLNVEMMSAEETRVDLAEAKIDQAVQNSEQWAVLHTLETKGASRGWAKRQQIDLRAYAQANDLDVRQVLGDVAAAISAGEISLPAADE